MCVAFAAMLGVGREAFRGHKFKGNESSLMMMMMMMVMMMTMMVVVVVMVMEQCFLVSGL